MKLNHINLTDVQEASNFLVNYFGMRSMGGNKGNGLPDGRKGWVGLRSDLDEGE